MSKFLGFESYLIPLGAAISDVHTTIRSSLTSKGWQIVHDSLTNYVVSTLGTFTNTTYKDVYAFTPDYANSVFASCPATTGWLGAQLNTSVQIVKVGLVAQVIAEAPKNFTIDYSDDGSTWTVAATITGQTGWYVNERRYFTIPPSGAHKYWRINVTANNGSANYLSLKKLELYDQFGTWAIYSSNTYFDAIPPSSELIGDSNTRELVRVEFTSNTITMRAVLQTLVGSPHIICVYPTYGDGTTIPTVTVNGVTVQQPAGTINASNTALQNVVYLYDALRSSSDPAISGFSWELSKGAIQNAGDPAWYIYGKRSTVFPQYTAITLSATNASIALIGENIPVGTTVPQFVSSGGTQYGSGAPPTYTITTDLVNGFIYYLQVNSRGIALATKTTTNYYGPLHACYSSNAKAVASKPSTPESSVIELFVGYDDDSNNLDSHARASHLWLINDTTTRGLVDSNYLTYVGHPIGRYSLRSKIQDYTLTYTSSYNPEVGLIGSNIWWDDATAGNDFQVHRVSIPGSFTVNNNVGFSNGTGTILCSSADITDWYKFRGTVTNESLLIVADTQTSTSLSTAIALADAPTTITVADSSLFSASGYVAINDEIFQYTGVSGNVLTGVIRSKYASTARNCYVGDQVYQCFWFTVINGGALLCGYNRPS